MATVQSGRVAVIATGLVERDRRTGCGLRDNRLRYDGLLFMPGQRTSVEARHARGLTRRKQIQVLADLPSFEWWGAAGRILQCEPGTAHVQATERSSGALRIVQGTGYDPGNAAYRFHTAVNECSPHASAFVRYLTTNNNPFACPTQIDATRDMATVRALLLSADVVHCHVDQALTQNAGLPRRPRAGQVIVRHYHGTRFNAIGTQVRDEDQYPMVAATQDDLDGYVLVGARLTVCALRPGRIQWLPITVPVDRYAAMVPAGERPWPRRPFRIAHSPTKTLIKGTDALLQVCKRLTKRGIPVEPLLIQRRTHAEALRLRAEADASFDAFALGIQGSGLEAAAMGQPVVAGDAAVAALYREHLGEVPYTFAPDDHLLEEQIARLATDEAFYRTEAARVHDYCRRVHDYPAVAARYSEILTQAGARPLEP